jgi:hypothetical protein
MLLSHHTPTHKPPFPTTDLSRKLQNMVDAAKVIPCPTCGKQSPAAASPHLPLFVLGVISHREMSPPIIRSLSVCACNPRSCELVTKTEKCEQVCNSLQITYISVTLSTVRFPSCFARNRLQRDGGKTRSSEKNYRAVRC